MIKPVAGERADGFKVQTRSKVINRAVTYNIHTHPYTNVLHSIFSCCMNTELELMESSRFETVRASKSDAILESPSTLTLAEEVKSVQQSQAQ